jgi:hypothetical protein
MSRKFGRRYKRHQEKHREYFESLARQVVAERQTTVNLGVANFDVRLRRGDRWLDIREPNGSWQDNNTNVAGLEGDALVSGITDVLIATAAGYPGVVIPPLRSA